MQIEQSTLSNNRAVAGGAIYIQSVGAVATPLTVTGSTFSGNRATGASGGAIYSDGRLDVTNSTFSSNSAGGEGGAIYASSPFPSVIEFSTFSDNSAGSSGGGLSGNANVILSATIIANRSGVDCAGIVSPSCFTIIGVNYIQDGSTIDN